LQNDGASGAIAGTASARSIATTIEIVSEESTANLQLVGLACSFRLPLLLQGSNLQKSDDCFRPSISKGDPGHNFGTTYISHSKMMTHLQLVDS
jgi:hypothetical protein